MSGRYITRTVLTQVAEQLVEQDVAIIEKVASLRFVSGDQLTRMFFVDADPAARARAARRALLRLTRLGCLERLPRQVGGRRRGSGGFVYYLGPAGQRLSLERGWISGRRRRRSDFPGTLFVAHGLKVAELHTLLIEADRSRRIELLELSAEPACWRRFGGAGSLRTTLKPDSYVRLGAGVFEDSYFIEVDQGTIGSRALEAQLSRYAEYEVSGIEQAEHGVFPKTWWLAPTAERVARITAVVAGLPNRCQDLFSVAEFSEVIDLLSESAESAASAAHEKIRQERGEI